MTESPCSTWSSSKIDRNNGNEEIGPERVINGIPPRSASVHVGSQKKKEKRKKKQEERTPSKKKRLQIIEPGFSSMRFTPDARTVGFRIERNISSVRR
jgi:hypothetical protein